MTEALTVQTAEKTKVVVMLGDSTTLCDYNQTGGKLTDYLQLDLSQKRHLTVTIVNSGKGADTAKGGFTRLPQDVFAHTPTVVTISFGLNDTGELMPDEYVRWMEQIVQSIQTNSHARILLITSTPFNNERHKWREEFRSKGGLDEYMNAHICAAERGLAKKYNLPLCDLHAHFIARFAKDAELIDTLILPDGVHLTDQGNKVAAEYVAPYIEGLLAKPGNEQK